jgi:hypothetical protein
LNAASPTQGTHGDAERPTGNNNNTVHTEKERGFEERITRTEREAERGKEQNPKRCVTSATIEEQEIAPL